MKICHNPATEIIVCVHLNATKNSNVKTGLCAGEEMRQTSQKYPFTKKFLTGIEVKICQTLNRKELKLDQRLSSAIQSLNPKSNDTSQFSMRISNSCNHQECIKTLAQSSSYIRKHDIREGQAFANVDGSSSAKHKHHRLPIR